VKYGCWGGKRTKRYSVGEFSPNIPHLKQILPDADWTKDFAAP